MLNILKNNFIACGIIQLVSTVCMVPSLVLQRKIQTATAIYSWATTLILVFTVFFICMLLSKILSDTGNFTNFQKLLSSILIIPEILISSFMWNFQFSFLLIQFLPLQELIVKALQLDTTSNSSWFLFNILWTFLLYCAMTIGIFRKKKK